MPLLESLFRQERRPDEVIVADAGSEDSTAELVIKFAAGGFPVKLVSAGDSLPGAARNAAVAAASFEIIAMTDSGCVADENWLARLAEPLESGRADYVFGAYRLEARGSFQKLCAIAVFSAPNRVIGGEKFRIGSFVSFAAIKNSWSGIGAFVEDLRAGEDTLMARKLSSSGLRGAEAPLAVVNLAVDSPFAAILRKSMIYSSCRIISGVNTAYLYRLSAQYAVLLACSAAGQKGMILGAALAAGSAAARGVRKTFQFEEYITSGLGFLSFCALSLIILAVDAALLAGTARGLILKYGNRR